ncbi:phosphotransferase enzyme family protein [Cytobacillus sp. FJAT-54145]|uniref:Phosphotransferase enzyme family protein n=1 Tax=Cytobacillus spartinae TaxID=3299023 RepID=A0ABW6KJ06_9BACI
MNKQLICKMYQLSHNSSFSLLNDGENQTYLIVDGEQKKVLRKYRQNRYNLMQIQAEIDWLIALENKLLVPSIIPNKDSESVMESNQIYYVMFNHIDGTDVDEDSEENYHKLGRTMLDLHQASEKILDGAPFNWLGCNRPYYTEQSMLHIPLKQLLNASFLSHAEKDEYVKVADKLLGFAKEMENTKKQFIHADLHFGNILVSKSGWYILDFDEAGFGHRAIDIGVPRIHMISSNRIDEMWPSFKDGYSTPITENEVRYGTCLRIFYMAGKIPLRTDIEAIGKDPSKFIKRYLNFINQELSGTTPF